jgi:hypothetical protein
MSSLRITCWLKAFPRICSMDLVSQYSKSLPHPQITIKWIFQCERWLLFQYNTHKQRELREILHTNWKYMYIHNNIQIILGSYYFKCSSMNFYWLFFFFSHYYRKISKIILYSVGLIEYIFLTDCQIMPRAVDYSPATTDLHLTLLSW